jgi:thioredoxin reductase
MYDVIIIGAGPAGLSAALILGRCRRRVLICDSDLPRNAVSGALHGFLTRDGIDPLELRRLAREDLRNYPNVEFRQVEATDVSRTEDGFQVGLADGAGVSSRMLLIATGVIDILPEIPGIRQLYGRSVFHCPYCDGWEMRDRPLAVYGREDGGVEFALEMIGWSRDVVLCTDGWNPSPAERERLERNGVQIRREAIAGLEGRGGELTAVIFRSGPPLPRQALFFRPAQCQRSPLAEMLGCRVTDGGVVETGSLQGSEVPGLYLAGDASRSVQLAVVAAAEGAEAAFAINTALLQEDLQ